MPAGLGRQNRPTGPSGDFYGKSPQRPSLVGKWDAVPAMPVIRKAQPHRVRLPLIACPFTAAVARKVKRAEVVATLQATEAVDFEWNKLVLLEGPSEEFVF